MICYHWRNEIRLEYDPATGAAITRYPSGRWSGSGPVPEDGLHAQRLGIRPGEHRLVHELAHHLVGFASRRPFGSHVVLRDALHLLQDDESKIEEWHVTALTYLAFDATERWDADGNYPGALEHMEKCGIDAHGLAEKLKFLFGYAPSPDSVTAQFDVSVFI